MQENNSLNIPFWKDVHQTLDLEKHGVPLSSFIASPWKHLRQLGKRVPTKTLEQFPPKTFRWWGKRKIIH